MGKLFYVIQAQEKQLRKIPSKGLLVLNLVEPGSMGPHQSPSKGLTFLKRWCKWAEEWQANLCPREVRIPTSSLRSCLVWSFSSSNSLLNVSCWHGWNYSWDTEGRHTWNLHVHHMRVIITSLSGSKFKLNDLISYNLVRIKSGRYIINCFFTRKRFYNCRNSDVGFVGVCLQQKNSRD